jgi:hypothetical protein
MMKSIKETRDFFARAARPITEDWAKHEVLQQLINIKELSEALEKIYGTKDRTNRDSTLPLILIPILEQIYRHTP